jgi:hypothetical protein
MKRVGHGPVLVVKALLLLLHPRLRLGLLSMVLVALGVSMSMCRYILTGRSSV